MKIAGKRAPRFDGKDAERNSSTIPCARRSPKEKCLGTRQHDPVKTQQPLMPTRSSTLFLIINRFAGFDVMTLANNHLNDFGDRPVNYTINALKEVGIKSVGVTYGPYNSHQVKTKKNNH